MFLMMGSSSIAAPSSMLACWGKELTSNWWQLDALLNSPACGGRLDVGDVAVVFCFLSRFFESGLLEVGSPKPQVRAF